MEQPSPLSSAKAPTVAPGFNEAHSSGVSWAAVIGGAFVTAALSLALLTLGIGIGLSVVSPWGDAGASASRIGRAAIGWLVLTQLIASAVGGYLAGRLRTRWVHIHTHEVYFRDTAHGFLVWAVGLVIAAALLASTATSLVGGAERAAGAANGSESLRFSDGFGASSYVVDKLFRTTRVSTENENAGARGQVLRIFANGLRQASLPAADRLYLTQVVMTKTGASQLDAEKRVDDAFAEAQQTADSARKAVAHSMYWTFLALLIGAFSASVAATIGGKERDRVVVA
jgi:hypothetical protein